MLAQAYLPYDTAGWHACRQCCHPCWGAPVPSTHLQRPRVEVVRSGVEPVVPRVGDVVTARVVRINPRLAAGGRLQSCTLCCPAQLAHSVSGSHGFRSSAYRACILAV